MSIDDDQRAADHAGPEDLRGRAIARLKRKADFARHVMVYLAINAFIVLIWSWTNVGFFWPIFPMFFWGTGLLAHAWETYRPEHPSEDRVRREMDRLRRNGGD
ncbi:2TM domain-containing protein [Pseudonocardia sp. CA-107938]|uniref:2TM domain-containing protein n=1 Tax=Pseudonocardia sp. CA-107938 TaxID=3240021 RepID=UPI003D8C1457